MWRELVFPALAPTSWVEHLRGARSGVLAATHFPQWGDDNLWKAKIEFFHPTYRFVIWG